MIEIGPESDSVMNYAEAVMYCFALGAGWRLPTEEEYETKINYFTWYLNDPTAYRKYVIPVRDLA